MFWPPSFPASSRPLPISSRAIRAERQARPQRLLRLRRTHRQRDHLSAVCLLQRRRVRDGRGVERIEQERHSLPLQLLRLLVELDRVGARDLLDEADDLHLWEPKADELALPSSRYQGAVWDARTSKARATSLR